ncbi:MAG: transcriptional regulator [Thermoanaerobaculia bacterium]
MKDYSPAKNLVSVSVGGSVCIVWELHELSQNGLPRLTGIPQTPLSAIENDRVRLGCRARKGPCPALKCHPAVLVFPGWGLPRDVAA